MATGETQQQASIVNQHDAHPREASARDEREQDLQHIREALRGLRYGTVNIIIQDGVVVQIDRTEKRRVRQRDAK
ncbi:YezD family protein [Anatilimnocola sp. NA78]|uniref:YezD family protein n=1 Tax=Anatilimnocola sp. NA78 TaxID=3415683 RepID=UPI003CE50C14